jgi:hypothetical protein
MKVYEMTDALAMHEAYASASPKMLRDPHALS